MRRVVGLLEAQGWSVWWDTRIVGGERWDEVIEREITAARCVVVVWTPQSIGREWVHLEAHHGRDRGILVPLLAGVDKPPFAFSLIQARNLSGWDGSSKAAVAVQFLADVRQNLEGGIADAAPQPQPSTAPAGAGGEAEREWRSLNLDASDDPGLLMAFAAKWERADPVWAYRARQKAAGLDADLTQRRAAEEEERRGREAEERRRAQEAAVAGYRKAGHIKVDAAIVHVAPEGHFKPGAGKTEWFKDLDAGPEMVVVPAGSFTMGSTPSEIAALKKEYSSDWFDREAPQRSVTIKAPFAVGRFAITFDEWEAAGLSHKPRDEGWGKGRRPVINVSWEDAQAYVHWLSGRTGKSYRLLSEAEWEYCCRAETTTAFWWGDSISTHQANYDGNYTFGGGTKGEYRQRTVPVDSFEPNPWGLYQVHGNVWEWCHDTWHENYQGAPQDGSVWPAGDASLRGLRGGSWYGSPRYCRSAFRGRNVPTVRNRFVGFRLARTL